MLWEGEVSDEPEPEELSVFAFTINPRGMGRVWNKSGVFYMLNFAFSVLQ